MSTVFVASHWHLFGDKRHENFMRISLPDDIFVIIKALIELRSEEGKSVEVPLQSVSYKSWYSTISIIYCVHLAVSKRDDHEDCFK